MKHTPTISPLEARMLDILQRDASISMTELARQTNSSSATCWRRLREMEEEGVVSAPVRLVDPAKVGRGMDAFCQVRMKAQDAESRSAFQRAMDLEPAIVEVYSVSGDWDYLLHVVVKDIPDLETILMTRIHELDCVATASTMFVLRRVKHTTRIPV